MVGPEEIVFGVGKAAAKGAKVVASGVRNAAKMAANVVSNIAAKVRNWYNDLDNYKLDKNIDVPYLKAYKKRANTVLVVARVDALMKNINDPQLANQVRPVNNEYIIAEYNEANDEVVQSDFVYKERIDDNIMTALNANGNIILIKE